MAAHYTIVAALATAHPGVSHDLDAIALARIAPMPRPVPTLPIPTFGKTALALSAPTPPAKDPGFDDPLADPAAEPATPVPADPAAAPAADVNTTPPTSAVDDLSWDEVKPQSDPLEFFNRPSFAVSQFVDKIAIRPAAMVYRTVVPRPARDGVRNVLQNLGEPMVFVNDLLQLRPKRMLRTLARFLINTLIGAGGLFDIAKRKPFNITYHSNSLGDTLGYYGIGPGPYLYIPILGPSTLRDIAGQSGDNYVRPRLLGTIIHPHRKPFSQNTFNFGNFDLAVTIVSGLDQRERADDDLKAMFSDSIDKYATFRSNFLQDRQGQIDSLKAKDEAEPKNSALDDPLVDPAALVPVP